MESWDLIVVGGGIYGAALALEAVHRGLRPLLVERRDFGHATSWNSHRIVHGGLRYLQSLDLRRFRESVGERSWFLRHFPDLVRPLPCLMPLYGEGARRPGVLRLGLAFNHLLSRHRNVGLRHDRHLEAGGVLSSAEVRDLFPDVRTEGLRGGALWYDAVMTNSQRLLIELLRWACAHGARCLNYVEAVDLLGHGDQVVGIRARDLEEETTLELRAPYVVNAAGPWAASVAESLDREVDGLFAPSLAFNLLVDVEPLAEPALAVTAPEPDAHTYFLYPRLGRLYAGTAHAPWSGGPDEPAPDDEQIDRVLDDLSRAVPGLELDRSKVLRVYAGLLPAAEPGTSELAVRETIVDHASIGGPNGLVSVSGVKYTTARLVADKTLRATLPELPARRVPKRPEPVAPPGFAEVAGRLDPPAGSPADGAGPEGAGIDDKGPGADQLTDLPEDLQACLRRLVREESVLRVEDLLLRRVDWGEDPRLLERLRAPARRALEA